MTDDERALLELHEVDRRAHLEGDATLMGSLFAPTVREASGGEVRTISGRDLEQRFRDAWSTLRYLEWSDSVSPQVGASGDLGWMLVQVHARRETRDGTPMPDFDAAWIALYEKVDGRWLLTAVSSSVVEVPPGAVSG